MNAVDGYVAKTERQFLEKEIEALQGNCTYSSDPYAKEKRIMYLRGRIEALNRIIKLKRGVNNDS